MYCFIEVDCCSVQQEPFSLQGDILLLCDKEFNIPENRDLYLAMGGSAIYSSDMRQGLRCTETKHYGRGFPKNVSPEIIYRYAMYIIEPRQLGIYERLYGRSIRKTKAVSPSEAKNMIDKGEALPLEFTEEFYDWNRGETLVVPFVSYPGHVAPTWLYIDEIYENLKHCGLSLNELKKHGKQIFPSLVEFMEILESRYGKRCVRMVMFFLYYE